MTGILIIDDSDDDIKRATEILSSYGYHISGTAYNGEMGIVIYREKRPELVIIDLIMNGIHGIEVFQRIRTEYPDAKAILCTSAGQGSIVNLAMRTGVNGYVVKPYDPDILLSAVRRIMGSPT